MKRIKQNKSPRAVPQEAHRLAGDGAAHGDLNAQSRQAAPLASGGCRGGSERAFCPKQPSVRSSKLRRPADRDEREGVTEAAPSLRNQETGPEDSRAATEKAAQPGSDTKRPHHLRPPHLPGFAGQAVSATVKTSCVKILLPPVQAGT